MLERLQTEFGNYSDILAQWAIRQPDAIAIRDDSAELTWADLHDRVERLAATLIETGLERGQSVAILGTSCINYALVFLAAVRAGGVAAPLTTSASKDQLIGMARDSGALHMFIDAAKSRELAPDFAQELNHIPLEEIENWMAPAGTQAPLRDPDAKAPFNIIYSSGTTGAPPFGPMALSAPLSAM